MKLNLKLLQWGGRHWQDPRRVKRKSQQFTYFGRNYTCRPKILKRLGNKNYEFHLTLPH